MKIGIIAHALHAGGGISVAQNLIVAIAKAAPEHRYFISYPSGVGYEKVVASLSNAELSVFHGRNKHFKRFLYEQRQLRPALRQFRPDLILALGNIAIGGCDCPEAILCQNSYFWYPMKHFGKRSLTKKILGYPRLFLQRCLMLRSLKKTRNILLYQTDVARSRISHILNTKIRSIHCPNAVSVFIESTEEDIHVIQQLARYKDKFRLLYVTRYYPHKNIESIVETFRRFSAQLSDFVVFITIAPQQDPGAKKVLEDIDRYNLNHQIVNVGPIRQEELAGWFRGCDGLLMPTLLESFSATYLEAMHFGLPILTSDLDFAHEICGDGALYFDPWDGASIKDAMLRLKNDLAIADVLRRNSALRLQSEQKSWDEIAVHLLDGLKKAVGASSY